MSEEKKTCFVITPFCIGLYYFYEFYKNHIEKTHRIKCYKADEEYLSKPFMDKIKDNISQADVIIADCTGKNANVYYEIALAHTQEKKVILISQDRLKSDIQHYEYIDYDLNNPNEFIKKLDSALYKLFEVDYNLYYENANKLYARFCEDEELSPETVTKEVFIEEIRMDLKNDTLPKKTQENIKDRLLMRLLRNPETPIMGRLTQWLVSQGKTVDLLWVTTQEED